MSSDTRRPVWVDLSLLLLAFCVLVTLMGLGTWQLQRLSWKLDLIKAVEARAFGTPVMPPIGTVSARDHAYLRVRVDGIYRHDLLQKVKAVTELGPGHWLLTPLKTGRGHVWINRGFVPAGMSADGLTSPTGRQAVEGLLRITEPGGTLLEKNVPERNRWVSRDVATLSTAARLSDAADYFIDADHSGAATSWPRGGLAVVKFRNPHLVYAITWYAMAALLLLGIIYVVYDRKKNL